VGGRLVVIGGDAGGMAAATAARRQDPSLDVVALERGRWTSYSACGIPYLIGGEVKDLEDLVVRRPQQLRDSLGIDVRMRCEATAIDLDAGKVEVRNHEQNRTFQLGFDVVHLGTGARPFRPPLPGIDLPFVVGVQTLDDAAALLRLLNHAPAWAPAGIRQVVVVGAGYIGLEVAEAFVRRRIPVTVVTNMPEVMTTLDPDMGAHVTRAMRGLGITVRCGVEVTGFEPRTVLTGAGSLAADLVVLGMGVAPNARLAEEAGLVLGASGAVRVDRRQRTSAEVMYAAGDCCTSTHLVSGREVHVALGTVANKQARVAGTNIGGGYATFAGVLGTAVTKVCDLEVARTGLTESEAAASGFSAVAATIESTTTAGYLEGAGKVRVKAVAERGTGRLLGAQIVGQGPGAAKRIDVVATALTAAMTCAEVAELDLAYAPPFSPVWDPVAIAARKAAAAARDKA
jgi:NADPH-dependent 2,4-dienoyl-CoA reductase/sulfur reductase-like enzyme